MFRKPKKLFVIMLLPLALALFFTYSGEAKQPKNSAKAKAARTVTSPRPIFIRASNFAVSDAARDLPNLEATDASQSRSGVVKNELNAVQVKKLTAAAAKLPSRDGTLSKKASPQQPAPNAVTPPLITFDGISDADNSTIGGGLVAPSDENIAVGPNDIVQTVNDGFRVWDKSGNPRIPAKAISKLFTRLGGTCAQVDRGDPVVLHDRLADRWVISQFGFVSQTSPPYHECVAVSKTSDPTGEYYAYDFVTVGSEFPDYPKLGTWPDGYYMTVNQFTNGGPFNGAGVYALDRQKMIMGDPAAGMIYFDLDLTSHPEGIYAMQPSDMDGFQLPPAGAPNVFAYEISDEFESPPYNVDALRLFNFHADFTTPANSTFTERSESPLAVTAYDPRYPTAASGRRDIKQPSPAVNPTDSLDNIGYHLMYRLQYRNLGGNEYLVGSTTVNVSGLSPTTIANYQAGVRYFQLTKASAGAPYTLFDDATFSPDAGMPATGLNRWLPSAAIDGQGDLAVSFSTSSTSVFPSIGYAGRGPSPGGGLSGEQTLFSGVASQLGSGNRWGDYQSLQVDPADDCTFWTTNQYYSTSSTFNWRTRIGSFNFTGCTAPAQGTLSGTITNCDSGNPVSGAIVQVSNGFSGASSTSGTYSIKLPPGNYTATIIDPVHGCTGIGPFNVTITNGGTTTLNQCLSGVAHFAFSSAAVSMSSGNGNGVIDANECNDLNVSILNDGCLIGANVSAVLSTTTAGVTVVQNASGYPNTAENTTSANVAPFRVSTSNAFICGTPIDFVLTVNYTGGSSMISFSLPTCTVAPIMVNGSLAAGDLSQTDRLGRTGVASSCGVAKACPGPFGALTPHLYDVYTFQNGPTAACATIATTAGCNQTTNPILTKAHLTSYDPNNFCTNYLGDAGGSATNTSFSVDVPANQTLVVVVEESGNGGFGCASYSLQVSGLVGNVSGNGPCGAAPTAVSRKTHGAAGAFDVPLPLTGTPGLECRSGGANGDYQMVLTFPTAVTFTSASVTMGTGSVSTATGNGTSTVTVNLTSVADDQRLQVTLFNVNDGTTTANVIVPMNVVVGDTNASTTVSSADVSQTKAALGSATNGSNFRTDVNTNGTVSSTDVSSVKSTLGHGLP